MTPLPRGAVAANRGTPLYRHAGPASGADNHRKHGLRPGGGTVYRFGNRQAVGAAAGAQTVFAVIIGTGCGAGVAIQGRSHIGGNGTAGEWGHNPLPWMDDDELRYRAEVPCYCGKQGCIETFISGTGFATDYQRLSGQSLTGNAIMQRVSEQDPLAEQALKRYEMRLAKSLAHVVNILDPDVIVLGGGMSNVERLYQTVPELVKSWVFGGECETPIRKAVHGDSSGVRGAAWLWPL